MKKKKIANLVMVLIIIAIISAGIIGVGLYKGWFDKSSEDTALLCNIRGITELQRDGIAFAVTEDTVLRQGDRVSVDAGATVSIARGDGYITLGQSGVAEIVAPHSSSFGISVEKGEAFIDTDTPVKVSFDGKTVSAESTVAVLSVRKGAQSISVYHGKVEDAESGQMLEWIGEEKSVTELSLESLNDFNIAQLRRVDTSKELCFTAEQLEELEAKRLADKNQAVPSEDGKLACSITIRCDTILDNYDELDPAKAPYVPDNGCILPATTVEITEGESVFDVLNRVCEQYGIQIEYSWTPMYDSYYIEGINNLYEFDCGYESGWMYKVNGWFPNYGCSSYELTGGESIVWCYTCKGLGEDVGADGWN